MCVCVCGGGGGVQVQDPGDPESECTEIITFMIFYIPNTSDTEKL